ncbi:MAG TPA: helix-turn-helix domain-containing protein [Ktedonobacteraceae bacterium]|nr:helix-turn-helix domain-containing protein [Ktedonobacteraceae bacterium]
MPIDIDNETYYSVNEALAFLGIARDTLYRRIDEGKLRKYRHGAKNRVYFRLADLKALKELHPVEREREEESDTRAT